MRSRGLGQMSGGLARARRFRSCSTEPLGARQVLASGSDPVAVFSCVWFQRATQPTLSIFILAGRATSWLRVVGIRMHAES